MNHCISFSLMVLLTVVNCCTGPSSHQTSKDRITPDSLFDAYYHGRLSLNPLLATAVGQEEYNGAFVNFISEDHIKEMKEFYLKYESLAKTLDIELINEQEMISIEQILYNCRLRKEGLESPITIVSLPPFGFTEFVAMPINQFDSFVHCMGSLVYGIHPFNTVVDYENWLKRLEGYMEWLDTAVSNMRIASEEGVVLPKVIVERIIGQLENMQMDTESHVFYVPVLQMPGSISEEERSRLVQEYRDFLEKKLIPKYAWFLEFFKNEYLPRCRESHGLGALPGGEETYNYLVRFNTGTNMTPDEIFETGIREVERISDEMEMVKKKVGFEGSLRDFLDFIRQNEALRPYTEPEEVIAHFYEIYQRIKPKMTNLFDLTVQTGFEIRRTEAFREEGASAEMVPGYPGIRNTVFYIPVPDAPAYNIYTDETMFLHEMIPGHHLQIMLQKENLELPEFQRNFIENSSFSEGWALYAESLGKELGLYEDPYQYFGMLDQEMHRAIRLVTDVGIHAKGWTREEAIEYSLQHEAGSTEFITREIERYMVTPAQALAYKIGQLKIMELRAKAENALGDRFDIREFHTQVLNSGSIPLAVLEEKIDRWIQLSLANALIDAFYSFDADSLQWSLRHAPGSQPEIMYYQKWAECGNYELLNRANCFVRNDMQVICPVNVKDDLIGAL